MSDQFQDGGTTHHPVRGSYEDALAMVGYEAPAVTGGVAVSDAMIRLFCGVTEDPNPSYWNLDYAQQRWGGVISPPGMLFGWTLPLHWTPENPVRTPPLCVSIPLPGDTVINAKQQAQFYEPIRVGDRLTIRDRLEGVSELKTTHVGVGHFLTTVATVERQDGVVVAEITNTLFRYTAHQKGSSA